MAWFELAPSGVYQVCFRLGDKRFSRSLRTDKEKDAKGAVEKIDENLRLVERGRLEIPRGVDVVSFLLSDGKVSGSVTVNTLTLPELFREYFSSLPAGSLEESTIYTMGIHRNSLERFFGRRLVESIDYAALQQYVKSRPVQSITIRKELATLKTVWNFGLASNLFAIPFPTTKLKFPKGEEKPPFTEFQELWKRTKGRPSELWECCYLTKTDLSEFLAYVKKAAKHPFIYPMFVMCAHTGARRSEIARAKVTDVDFRDGFITLHERKRNREMKTTRRVPMSSLLRRVMRDWTKGREGHLFTNGGSPLTRKAMWYYFGNTLEGSNWEHLRGFHVCRHSMASNLAAEGIDQRIIDEVLGHTTEAMRRRYRHLLPNKIKQSVVSVFG